MKSPTPKTPESRDEQRGSQSETMHRVAEAYRLQSEVVRFYASRKSQDER